MTYLLDVNVMIALIDPAHVAHEAAHAWFAAEGARSAMNAIRGGRGALALIG